MKIRMVRAVMVLTMALLASAGVTAAAAQDDPPATTVTVIVRLCVDAGCTELLEATEPVSGMPVEITDAASGASLGSCVTGDDGACAVEMAWTEVVHLHFDDAATPEGYAPSSNPEEVRFGAEPMATAEAPVLFYPLDGELGDPPPVDGGDDAGEQESGPLTQLPETGAGAAAATDGSLTMLALGGSLVTLLAGMAMRRLPAARG